MLDFPPKWPQAQCYGVKKSVYRRASGILHTIGYTKFGIILASNACVKTQRKNLRFPLCGFGGFLLVEAPPQALANTGVLERRVPLRLCDGL